ncbi:putative Repressor protein C2 [Vibrio nigripulchritudo SOn1]|uniref:Repressor protein C2 n=1 Tax=Vibrio nigripulchritudo SOn1 TaxID=1238450 RepID=A0AAV2VUP6_9VIBR|nr:S24 family peptidase [Vibrio nigripulchritudo]CCO48459.1 putative Repressor protein C2 [Vibrio nigripulchritudo SOn1]
MDTSDRIKQRMNASGLRAVDVARLTGASKGTVSQWLNGIAKPSGGYILALSKALDCQADWLLSGKGAPNNFAISNVRSESDLAGSYPLLSWTQARQVGGDFDFNLEDNTRYRCPVSCSDSTFVLKVQGVSMQPIFNDGDLIFIDPEADKTNGKYVIAIIEGEEEVTFRQLIIEGKRLFLKPNNPNWPEQLVPIEESFILGVIIFGGRTF